MLVPKTIDKVFFAIVNKHCANLPTKNKKIIVNCLRNNYANKGFIFKKMHYHLNIRLCDLYSAFIAHNRHFATEYNSSLYEHRKKFNNHNFARTIFKEYYEAAFIETESRKPLALDNNYFYKVEYEQLLNIIDLTDNSN